MSNLGWTSETTKSHSDINFQTLPVEPILSALEWKHRVYKKKQEVLEQRKQHAQPLPNQNTDTEQQSPHMYTVHVTTSPTQLRFPRKLARISKDFILGRKPMKRMCLPQYWIFSHMFHFFRPKF
jgi:hypothetical protein